MLHIWGAEPDLWSGGAKKDLADYDAWLTELAIWEAMTGQGEYGTEQDDTGTAERRGSI